MPNHMKVISFLLGIKPCTDSITDSAEQDETDENPARFPDDQRCEYDCHPPHHKIKYHADFGTDFWTQHFIQDAEDSCNPLNEQCRHAPKAADDRNGDRSIGACDGDIYETVIKQSHNVLMFCIMRHRMIQSRSQKHQENTDDIYRAADCILDTAFHIHVNRSERKQEYEDQGSHTVTDTVADLLAKR